MANGITINHSYDRSTFRIEIEVDRNNIEKSSEMTIRINPKAPRTRIPDYRGSGRRTVNFWFRDMTPTVESNLESFPRLDNDSP